MHPTLARFLNLAVTRDTLQRAERGEPLDAGERALVRVAQRAPDQRRQLGKSGASSPSQDAQRAGLYLALHAAAESVREDAALEPAVKRARDALFRADASTERIDGMMAALLAEEAFGYEDDAGDFDRAFFAETLESLPALLSLTREGLAAIRAELLLGVPAAERKAADRTFEALCGAAWSDGVEPITPEHLAEARERLTEPAEQASLATLLPLLHRKGLVGPLRLARLQSQLPRS